MNNILKKLATVLGIALCVCVLLGAPDSTGAEHQSEKISINFVNVEISSIVKIMSELTGKNFIFDDTLKGKVTIVAPMKLSTDEALELFTSSLELKKYTIISVGKGYKVIPLTQARQSAAQVVRAGGPGLDPVESYVVRLVPLDYISTQDAFTLVQPLMSRYGQLSIFGARNALLIVDSVANTKKIMSILSSVDTEPMTDEPEIVYLSHTKAETIVELLRIEAQRSGLGWLNTPGAEGTGGGISADLRLNAIILSLPIKARNNLKRFISVLDTPGTESSSRINVYYLENAEATELSGVLDRLLNSSSVDTDDPTQLSSKISITPDKSSNSLIIMASPADYQGLVHVIKKLDRRPKQVFVEAMITEVSIGKALDLGTKWRVAGVSGGEPIAIGGVGTINQSEIQKVVNGMSGLSIGGLGNYISVPVTKSDGTTFNLSAPGFAALFSLSEFNDVVNILSTPHILTSDNSEAEIVIGKNVPFLSSIERQATTTSQPLLQSIERKNVGITLRIKPKISEGGFVKLDLFQEISALATTTVSGASDLITTTRSAKTTVVVKDRQTVVIGGLIQTQKVKSVTKVPILGDIPILSWLFKYSSEQDEKTNLLIYVTPYIIDNFEELEELRSKKKIEFGGDPIKELPDIGGYKSPAPAVMSAEVLKATTDAAAKESVVPVKNAGEAQQAKSAEVAEPKTSTKPTKPTTVTSTATSTMISKNTATVPVAKSTLKKSHTSTGPQPPAGATIRNIRTGEHKKYHRVVIELTAPAKYRVTRRAESATIRITGASSGGVTAAEHSTELMNLSGPVSTQLESGPVTKLDLSFKRGSRVKNSTLENPYRIVVDVYRTAE
ncbi:MAG: type II secretion system secretin GspD [Proteobacteria bacterium]|nr:type II secretion system secretin GspD [Pseudomonadota bacterium]